jgi:hypothetical protein
MNQNRFLSEAWWWSLPLLIIERIEMIELIEQPKTKATIDWWHQFAARMRGPLFRTLAVSTYSYVHTVRTNLQTTVRAVLYSAMDDAIQV